MRARKTIGPSGQVQLRCRADVRTWIPTFHASSSYAKASEAGDFTNQIGNLVPGTAIGIDGPYGEFTLNHHSGDAVLLLAGGVGIAPIMGLLRDLVARRDPQPIRQVVLVILLACLRLRLQ